MAVWVLRIQLSSQSIILTRAWTLQACLLRQTTKFLKKAYRSPECQTGDTIKFLCRWRNYSKLQNLNLRHLLIRPQIMTDFRYYRSKKHKRWISRFRSPWWMLKSKSRVSLILENQRTGTFIPNWIKLSHLTIFFLTATWKWFQLMSKVTNCKFCHKIGHIKLLMWIAFSRLLKDE